MSQASLQLDICSCSCQVKLLLSSAVRTTYVLSLLSSWEEQQDGQHEDLHADGVH